MNFSPFIKQSVPQIQIILILHVTKELRKRELEGRESLRPIRKQTCLVTGVYHYCIAEDPSQKYSFLFPNPTHLPLLYPVILSHLGRADTCETLAYGIIWKESLP